MLPTAAREVLRLTPDIDGLLRLLSQVTGRPNDELAAELRTHLAARIAFLLLGEVEDAPNYNVILKRLTARLRISSPLEPLTDAIARTLLSLDAAADVRRMGLLELPYPARQHLFQRQGHRCAVCGWKFADMSARRGTLLEGSPTLDHRIPYRVGGEHLENLWILCGLCNSIKEATIHVGEHGRVWSNNYIYFPRVRAVAFWTFVREGVCRSHGCGAPPATARLYVERLRHRGAWILDNCTVRCELHVTPSESIDY
jgi:hypothetical protein